VEIGLFTLVVADYDDAMAFYIDKVGFQLVEDSPAIATDGSVKRWVVVRPPGATTGIVLAEAADDAQRLAVGNHAGGRIGLFLNTNDFAGDHARMKAAGINFVGEPRDEPHGRFAIWEDLYGNRWDLIEPPSAGRKLGSATVPVSVPTLSGQPLTTAEPSIFPPPEDIGEILLSEAAIAARIGELGEAIAADYAGEVPLLVGVLKGSMLFVADLLRAVAAPVEVDFLAVSSYGAATKSSGVVRIVKDLEQDVAGRHVILVEDIVDTGLTLRYLLEHFSVQQPASLRTCSLLVREREEPSEFTVDYPGFLLPQAFVIGYGLDVAQRYRNLSYIASYAKA